MDPPPQQQSLDLSRLPLDNLLQLRTNIESDMKTLSTNVRTLRVALERYSTSLESVAALAGPPRQMLIPLSSSMYMPGKTAGTDKVMVDLGTGFYASMPIAQAQQVVQRKIDYVSKNIAAFEDQFDNLREMLQRVQAQTQARVAAQTASSQPARA